MFHKERMLLFQLFFKKMDGFVAVTSTSQSFAPLPRLPYNILNLMSTKIHRMVGSRMSSPSFQWSIS